MWKIILTTSLTLSPESPLQPGAPIRPILPWRFPRDNDIVSVFRVMLYYKLYFVVSRLTFWPSVPFLPAAPDTPWVFGRQWRQKINHSRPTLTESDVVGYKICTSITLKELFTFAPPCPMSPCRGKAEPWILTSFHSVWQICRNINRVYAGMLTLNLLRPF